MTSPRIDIVGIPVNDQAKALEFYTSKLGFVLKTDKPSGEFRWLTVVSADDLDGPQLLLEPNQYPAAQTYYKALKEDGIPALSFGISDLVSYCEDLEHKGVVVITPPKNNSADSYAIIDDTCGNLICFTKLA